ncbi:Response regulator receiver domain-containing protein [Maridesulfovibrio ferrireducens]|uniref:Response regulator receiver domain-containing protein n=1 Tax=Maridesulfovibrio ferrireducens TaxID=246191 RepID=A0A1G9KR83_9BACT|nr:response regulator [Maridesulfovibrio ferrireducens]SDL51957.1 Response regulator receiver domain-containing protein [Maridesulfovibrio ferrireducens]
MNEINKECTFVLVEDDLGHARLIQKNLHRSGVQNKIVHLTTGRQAVDFLLSQGEYAGSPPPATVLVLLDLNLPEMDGFTVLKHLKADERSKNIPVIMLTTTDDSREVKRCYELGCSVFITKPVDYDLFSEAIQKLGRFLNVIKLPDGGVKYVEQ